MTQQLIFLPSPLISSHHRQACKRKISRWADIYDEYDCSFGEERLTLIDFVCSLENKAIHDTGRWLSMCLEDNSLVAIEHYMKQYGSYYAKAFPILVDITAVAIPAWLLLEIKEYGDYIESL